MNPLPSSTIALIAHAAGWTLLHFLWQGALVALILACVLALLSGRSAQPRYLAACTALVLMAILPIITFTRIVAAEHSAANTFLISIPLNISVTGHGIATPSEPLLYRIAAALDRSMPAVLAVWLAGVVLLFLRLGIGLVIARRMMSAATQPPPCDLLHVFHQLARRIEVTRPIRLLHSTLVQVPTVIGWLRPVVLIPLCCLSGLSPTQVEAILAHELAHIRRHDYLVSVLQSIVEALLFYHPAVWWVSRHIRREREHCCDDLAVQYTGDALTYARALSLLEEHRSALPAIALGANGGILTMRIKRLLGSKESAAAPQLVALALLGIVIAATGICVTTAARAQNNPTQFQQPHYNPPAATTATEDIRGPEQLVNNVPAPAPRPQAADGTQSSPAIAPQYQAWLDQDVRWLISPQERAAFLQLTSDAERDHFIEQFWQSHNSPGSAPGSYRAEHYRRIAYANQHFTAAGLAGWESDRGRMYIVNGAPSTIDSHPSAAPYGHPYQTWGYGAMKLTFVDFCDCDNYQLLAQSSVSSSSSTSSQSHNSSSSSRPQNIEKLPVRNVSYQPSTVPQPESAQPPVRVSPGVMAGQVLTRVDPIYPPEAKANDVEGVVVLHAVISKTGEVRDLDIVSGPDELRTSAIDAIRQWTYRPYLLNGEPTEVETTVTVNYQLGDPADSQSQDNESAAGGVPKKIGGGVSAPVLIDSVAPEFSEQAKQNKVGGIVLVHLWVDEQGRPEHVRVLRGVGNGLDEKAVEAVKQYKFNPAMEGGKPVLVELNTEVNFKIF
jgi:TonB family protein